MTAPFFSIVIPTLNEEKCISNLLHDLQAQKFQEFEVIVVDATSKDSTVHLAKKTWTDSKRLRLVNAKKRGASYQRNTGAMLAKASYLLFVDADTRLPWNYLEKLKSRLLRSKPDVFTTFAIPDTDAESDKAFLSAQNYLSLGASLAGKPYASAACMGATKDAFDLLHGFDEKLEMWEDSNFCQRAVELDLQFQIFQTPTYIFSMRRYQKDGKVKIVFDTMPNFFQFFFQNKTQSMKKKYPMRGGGQY